MNEGSILEKLLLGSLTAGMLLAFCLTKVMEEDKAQFAASPYAGDPGTVTVDLRR